MQDIYSKSVESFVTYLMSNALPSLGTDIPEVVFWGQARCEKRIGLHETGKLVVVSKFSPSSSSGLLTRKELDGDSLTPQLEDFTTRHSWPVVTVSVAL